VKAPVGMTLSPMDFRATHLILTLRRLLFCVRKPSPPKSVDLPQETIADPVSLFDLPASLPLAGRRRRLAVLFCGALGSRAAEKQRWLLWQRNRAA
jgi:hypothetical protein